MYWANPKDSYIEVAHMNGSSHYALVTEDLDKPMSLAVDPSKGFLFWSDISKGHIERANLDGSNRKVIVASNTTKVADITLDTEVSITSPCFYHFMCTSIHVKYLFAEPTDLLVRFHVR